MLTSISRKCRDFIRLIVIGTDHARHDVHISLFSANNFISLFTVVAGVCFFLFDTNEIEYRLRHTRHPTKKKY